MNLKSNLKKLKKGISNTGGRNNSGKITHFHHGKKHKQKYRQIDFKNNKEGIIRTIEYDPNRTALIASIQLKNNEIKYILLTESITIGSNINTTIIPTKKSGNTFLLKDIPIGTFIHNIELNSQQGGKFIRAAGTYGQIIKIQNNYVKIRLPSNEERLFLNTCSATIGKVSNVLHNKIKLKKAGNNRWKGIRPTVRGTAMNPIDHPHGGGQGKTSGGRCSVSPWGKLTKGKKTVLKKNNLIILKSYKKK